VLIKSLGKNAIYEYQIFLCRFFVATRVRKFWSIVKIKTFQIFRYRFFKNMDLYNSKDCLDKANPIFPFLFLLSSFQIFLLLLLTSQPISFLKLACDELHFNKYFHPFRTAFVCLLSLSFSGPIFFFIGSIWTREFDLYNSVSEKSWEERVFFF